MTIDLQSWLRHGWQSLMEPAQMAAEVLALRLPKEAMWTGLALVAVLNVLLLGIVQMVSPATAELQKQMVTLTPFSYLGIIGAFLTFLVFMLVHAGRMMGGTGTIEASLTLLVWFQALSLTLEFIQIVIVLISPTIAGLFELVPLGAIIWVFINMIRVLHDFDGLGKSVIVIFIALIGTVLGTGLVMSLLGINPVVGAV